MDRLNWLSERKGTGWKVVDVGVLLVLLGAVTLIGLCLLGLA